MKQRSRAARNRRFRRVVIPYLFLMPFLVLFLVFLVLPLAYALGISLFENRLVGGTDLRWRGELSQGDRGP